MGKVEVIYEEDLGINFNGYPLETVDRDKINDVLMDNECRRFYKNKHYKLKIIVEEVKNNVIVKDDNLESSNFTTTKPIDFEECNCECHNNNFIMHFMPCCGVCPHCHKNIDSYYYNDHVTRCEKEYNDSKDMFIFDENQIFDSFAEEFKKVENIALNSNNESEMFELIKIKNPFINRKLAANENLTKKVAMKLLNEFPAYTMCVILANNKIVDEEIKNLLYKIATEGHYSQSMLKSDLDTIFGIIKK